MNWAFFALSKPTQAIKRLKTVTRSEPCKAIKLCTYTNKNKEDMRGFFLSLKIFQLEIYIFNEGLGTPISTPLRIENQRINVFVIDEK